MHNKGVQGTAHMVRCPLTPDVQRDNMKTIYILFLCALLSGCSPTRTVKTDTERTIVITQISGTRYCLQATESVQVSDKNNSGDSSGKTDTLNYLIVCADVGGNTETEEIKTPNGQIATSASLALREEQGSLIATYELKKMLSDGSLDSASGEIEIK